MASIALQSAAQPTETPIVLLVEDEPRVRRVMANVLSSEGFFVLESATAEHVLAQPQPYLKKVALLITDVMLPGKTGRELAHDLRSRVPGIKTILVSGYGENFALLGTEATDGIRYLPKPFSASSLIGAVRAMLDGSFVANSRQSRSATQSSLQLI